MFQHTSFFVRLSGWEKKLIFKTGVQFPLTIAIPETQDKIYQGLWKM